MILDEKMEMPIVCPIRVAGNGEFFEANTFIMSPPQPKMAKHLFKMSRYFSLIQKEIAKFISETNGDAVREQAQEALQAGSPIEALHDEYKDGDTEDARKKKLKEIEEMIEGFKEGLMLCDTLDLYQMTTDFGEMIVSYSKCMLRGATPEGDVLNTPLTRSVWEQSIDHKDRVAAMIRYCCFFGLTSSTH